MINLFGILNWLLEVGAGTVAWYIVDRWAWAQTLGYEQKRWLALGVAGVTALAAWLVMLLFFYQAAPVGWRAWVEGGVAVLAKSLPFVFTVSQLAHARAKARRALKAERQ